MFHHSLLAADGFSGVNGWAFSLTFCGLVAQFCSFFAEKRLWKADRDGQADIFTLKIAPKSLQINHLRKVRNLVRPRSAERRKPCQRNGLGLSV